MKQKQKILNIMMQFSQLGDLDVINNFRKV